MCLYKVGGIAPDDPLGLDLKHETKEQHPVLLMLLELDWVGTPGANEIVVVWTPAAFSAIHHRQQQRGFGGCPGV